MKQFFSLLFITAIHCSAAAQSTYWQQEVHYTIDVSLNDSDHTLDGFLKLRYVNHSPDTLTYIWFHLWPNAFKNDQTAFSEQLLLNGRTDFYFSDKEKRGYINRLDFRVNNNTLRVQDHPQFIDVVQVFLPSPLLPGQQTTITTPFHVKLPANFSRGGHIGQNYQVTQWYPKPAVYDRKGWHPMPYLDQGEFYSEFGSFDVRITLPETYTVAATGELQNPQLRLGKKEEQEQEQEQEQEHAPLKTPSSTGKTRTAKTKTGKTKTSKTKTSKTTTKNKTTKSKTRNPTPETLHPTPYTRNPKPETRNPKPYTPNPKPETLHPTLKTLQFKQDRIHDFAWLASKNYTVKEDTIQLASGRIIKAFSFYKTAGWEKTIQYIKDAVRFRSQLMAEYPYNVVSVVEAPMGFTGGMEYPTITSISPMKDGQSLDETIEHEIGHNWLYGILASNERDYPWMDEGMNSYYDQRYSEWKYPQRDTTGFMGKRLPANPETLLLDALARKKEDQPINAPSVEFTRYNYGLVAYGKAAAWMKELEQALGRDQFDAMMKAYYAQWQFKHPYPEDFRKLVEEFAGKDMSELFARLDKKGPVNPNQPSQKIKPVFLFSCKDYDRTNYIGWTPIPGYNHYDQFMIGLLLHNYNLPSNRFQFVLAPLYATNSSRFNGIGRISYSWLPEGRFKKIEIAAGASRFSTLSGADSSGNKVFGGFFKLTPSIRLTWKNRHTLSSVEKWIEWKTYLISERGLRYVQAQDEEFYPEEGKAANRYLNQLTFSITDFRELYPYDVQLQLQQGEGFYRASATGHYFFNYAKGGGMQVRLFAAKFGYLGEKTLAKEFETAIYHPKLTAVRGGEDYTYSNYFFGRNEFEGFASQQIMMRDGGLKLRTDLFSGLQGRSDDWIASINFSTTLPNKLFPVKVPLRIFLDAGTYAEAWKKGAATSRFLYVAGLELSLFKDLLHFYAPIIYSKEFRDNLKTVPEENKFFKRLSFSIDIHRLNLRKITGNEFPSLW